MGPTPTGVERRRICAPRNRLSAPHLGRKNSVLFVVDFVFSILAHTQYVNVGAKEGVRLVRVVSEHSLHVISARRRLLRSYPDRAFTTLAFF
jgi:hypothetical protein